MTAGNQPPGTDPTIVRRMDCRPDLLCIGCGHPEGRQHDVLCYVYAIARRDARNAGNQPSVKPPTKRVQCNYTIDSLRNDRPRGKSNRPWWRRSCKRWVVVPEDTNEFHVRCWQHR